jgi:hypothetical protein
MIEAMTASLVLVTNGGTGRVAITLERPGNVVDAFPGATAGAQQEGKGVLDPLASISATKRLGFGLAVGGVIGIVLLLIGQAWPLPSDAPRPSLPASAILFAVLGAVCGGMLAQHRGTSADLPAGIGSGAVAGVMVAALVVAIGRGITQIMGQGGGSLVGWVVVGAALAGMSLVLVPCRTQEEAKG